MTQLRLALWLLLFVSTACQPAPPVPYSADLTSVWALDDNNVWITGQDGAVFKWDGSVWSAQKLENASFLNGVWASSTDSVLVTGREGIFGWNGVDWAVYCADEPFGLWGIDNKNIWASSNFQAISRIGLNVMKYSAFFQMHWNGTSWQTPFSEKDATDIIKGYWGSDASNVWGVGRRILKWNGTSWQEHSGPRAQLWGIWGSDKDNVWAIGEGGIVKWNGTDWVPQNRPVQGGLSAIWGSSAYDIWIVGAYGLMLHWDGTAWSLHRLATREHLLGISGSGANRAWAVGTRGTLLKWNGIAWKPQLLLAP